MVYKHPLPILEDNWGKCEVLDIYFLIPKISALWKQVFFNLSESFFLCIGWKKSDSFQPSVNHCRVSLICWEGWTWAAVDIPEKAAPSTGSTKQSCNNDPQISALVEAFTFSLRNEDYSLFVIRSVSLASPHNFMVPLELDGCWRFTFILCTLCNERSGILPFSPNKFIFYVTYLTWLNDRNVVAPP